jgi:hypothetical protein
MQETSGRVMVVSIPSWLYHTLMARRGKRNSDERRMFAAETGGKQAIERYILSYCLREFSWKEVERGIT